MYFPQWMKLFYSFFCSFYFFKKLETIISLTVNPLLSPPGGLIYFISSPFERGLHRDRGLFNLEKTMVSVLHEELEYKVENLKYKKVGK